jgi:predicted Ser/Thr protein kinase
MDDDRTRVVHGTVTPPAEQTKIVRTSAGAAAATDEAGAAAGDAPQQRPDFHVTRWNSQTSLEEGDVLNHTYRIDKFLARGGMGAVYRATHILLNTQHAIKIILSDLADNPDVLEALRREANALRRVRNDAVVEYEGLHVDDHGRRFLVMQFVEGPSLGDVIKDRSLTPAEVRSLKNRLALGLAAAHEVAIIHRDISPDNIILREGHIDKATIIDFGIAKTIENDPTKVEHSIFQGDFVGKYAFASPEHFSGNVEPRSDIYSLALVLAAAAIGHGGRLKLGGSLSEMILARQKVPDLDQVPSELRPDLMHMLQPNPEDRPPTMLEVVDPEARPATIIAPPRPAVGPYIFRGLAVAVVVIAALLVGYRLYPAPVLRLFGVKTDVMARQISHRLEALGCSTITSRVSQDYRFHTTVTLTGTVATSNDRDSAADLARLPGVGAVTNALTVVPWPFCDIVNLTHAVDAGAGDRAAPVINGNMNQLVYRDGDCLVLHVTATPMFDGYVYIDYFDQDGTVVHMLPNVKSTANKAAAGQEFTIGTDKCHAKVPGAQAFVVTEPFGQSMIMVTSSPQPLFAKPSEDEQGLATTYLANLRDAVTKVAASGGQSPIIANRFLTTEPAVK